MMFPAYFEIPSIVAIIAIAYLEIKLRDTSVPDLTMGGIVYVLFYENHPGTLYYFALTLGTMYLLSKLANLYILNITTYSWVILAYGTYGFQTLICFLFILLMIFLLHLILKKLYKVRINTATMPLLLAHIIAIYYLR